MSKKEKAEETKPELVNLTQKLSDIVERGEATKEDLEFFCGFTSEHYEKLNNDQSYILDPAILFRVTDFLDMPVEELLENTGRDAVHGFAYYAYGADVSSEMLFDAIYTVICNRPVTDETLEMRRDLHTVRHKSLVESTPMFVDLSSRLKIDDHQWRKLIPATRFGSDYDEITPDEADKAGMIVLLDIQEKSKINLGKFLEKYRQREKEERLKPCIEVNVSGLSAIEVVRDEAMQRNVRGPRRV